MNKRRVNGKERATTMNTISLARRKFSGIHTAIRTIFALLLFLGGVDAIAANGPPLVIEEFIVPSVDPGISLYVRNKHPQQESRLPAEKILLYVHGATYPAETTFDLKLNGFSWMDYLAQHGYDVYLVDLRGYGRSTRPPEMDHESPRV